MASMNKVILCGNLTRDPDLKFIPSGAAVCNINMAMNRKWKDAAGIAKDEVCYVRVVAWGKQAEACGEYLKKGSPILVEGRLQSRSWETDKGEKRYSLDVVAERVQFLSRPATGTHQEAVSEQGYDGGQQAPALEAAGGADDDIPF